MSAPNTIAAIAAGPRIIRLLAGGGPPTVEIEPLRFVPVIWSRKYQQAKARRA